MGGAENNLGGAFAPPPCPPPLAPPLILNLTVFVNELSTICFANFRNEYFQVCQFLFKETFSKTSIHPSKVF